MYICFTMLKFAGCPMAKCLKFKNELAVFLEEKKSHLAERFSSNTWFVCAAYLAHIFNHLNYLNLSLQGRGHNRLQLTDKIAEFKKNPLCEQTCFK